MNNRAIVLVGPAGVGKTTVGKKLANALGRSFIDTDALFVKDHGDIAKFFTNYGEPAFRSLEEDYLLHAVNQSAVVATGGGAVVSPKNREAIKDSIVVYLSTDGTHMAKRISQGNRPLLPGGIEDWKTLYEKRRELYEKVATFTIDTSGHPLKQTINEIRQKLDQYDSNNQN